MGLSALRKTQKGFDATVLAETSEAVFDATACYFPVTFTPPPNDPHNISPDALRTGARLCCCIYCAGGIVLAFNVGGRALALDF